MSAAIDVLLAALAVVGCPSQVSMHALAAPEVGDVVESASASVHIVPRPPVEDVVTSPTFENLAARPGQEDVVGR